MRTTNDEPKCKCCRRPFDRRRPWQEFCSDRCRKDFHRYGTLSRAKMAELFQREARRVLKAWAAAADAESAALAGDLAELRGRVVQLQHRLEELEGGAHA